MTLIVLYQKLKLKKDSVVLQRSNMFKRCTEYTFCCLVAHNGHNLSVGGLTRLLIDAIDSAIMCPAASPVGTKCVYFMYSIWVQLVCLSLKHDGTKMTMPTNSHVSINVENTTLVYLKLKKKKKRIKAAI